MRRQTSHIGGGKQSLRCAVLQGEVPRLNPSVLVSGAVAVVSQRIDGAERAGIEPVEALKIGQIQGVNLGEIERSRLVLQALDSHSTDLALNQRCHS